MTTATRKAFAKEVSNTSFRSVVAARMANLKWVYTRAFFLMPWGALVTFIVGLLALRRGVYEHPNRHRLIIIAATASDSSRGSLHTGSSACLGPCYA